MSNARWWPRPGRCRSHIRANACADPFLSTFEHERISRRRWTTRDHAPSRHGQNLPLGLADASLVVLAARYGTDIIGTLDERHFRVVQSLSGRPLRIVPADTGR